MSGTLVIKPLSAKLTRDTETFGTMDPYCQITFGSQKFKTAVAHNAGKTPSWNDTFTVRRANEDQIAIDILEHDTFSKDDYIAQGNFPLQNIFLKGSSSEWINLNYKGKPAGQILIGFQFTKDGGQQPQIYQPMQQPMQQPQYIQQQQYPQQQFPQQMPQQQFPQQQFPQQMPQQQFPQQMLTIPTVNAAITIPTVNAAIAIPIINAIVDAIVDASILSTLDGILDVIRWSSNDHIQQKLQEMLGNWKTQRKTLWKMLLTGWILQEMLRNWN
eukprot:TRINITY_DN368_c0_g1_i3.p1 TRINITY_DN368_c0_g1~~TRINITY_DN368_c0_g1_i3.p1  ORF type:complete len:272 (+),score=33.34 TRINITY_DN368_c0_g1_i3:98-913(+)